KRTGCTQPVRVTRQATGLQATSMETTSSPDLLTWLRPGFRQARNLPPFTAQGLQAVCVLPGLSPFRTLMEQTWIDAWPVPLASFNIVFGRTSVASTSVPRSPVYLHNIPV